MLFKAGLWTKWFMLIRNESWTFQEEPFFLFWAAFEQILTPWFSNFFKRLVTQLDTIPTLLNAVWKPILPHKLHGFLLGISGRTLFLKKVDISMPTVLKKFKLVKANSETNSDLNEKWLHPLMRWKLLILSPAKAVSRKVLKTLSVLIGKK